MAFETSAARFFREKYRQIQRIWLFGHVTKILLADIWKNI